MSEVSAATGKKLKLTAYQLAPNPGFVLEPAPARRQWMDDFPGRIPYRCLPLAMANQGGWLIRSPVGFRARWNGKMTPDAMKIDFEDGATDAQKSCVNSHFGGGIITFLFPWLFRTPEGYGLWEHGPPNWPMHNVVALEGIIETSWSHMTFTMNWQIMRRNADVWFKKGDPVAMLTPFPLDMLETFDAEIVDIRADPQLHQDVTGAFQSRAHAIRENVRKTAEGAGADELGWEKNYMHGKKADKTKERTHRTNFKLAPFEDRR